jgi:DNA polymerase III subunit gamma/tau
MLPGSENSGRMPGQTQSLYRKYRPTTFASDDLVGQEHISRTLRNAIAQDRVAHAYLFCGPRGTGKTSTARLLAKAVNCLDPEPANRPCNACTSCVAINQNRATDVIEIDAASNRGIEDMRDLREQVKYAPTQLKTKIYIIDEAHRLTKDAFNAFLKTLEEPPPNTIFVLATTEPEDLLETVASRCQRFDFHRIAAAEMSGLVKNVARAEGIEIEDSAVEIIVRQATGSARDALGLLDMLAVSSGREGSNTIDADLVRQMLGLSQDQRTVALIEAIASKDVPSGLQVINDAVEAGQDMRSFGRQIIAALRLLMLLRAGANPAEADDALRQLAQRFELPDLLRVNRLFSEVDFAIRNGGFPQLPLEIALVGSIVDDRVSGSFTPPAQERVAEPRRVTPPSRQPEPTSAQPSAPRPKPSAPASTPAAPEPREPQVDRPPSAPASSGSLDVFVSNWDMIRTEVKTVDRKVDALLASTDPGDFRDGTLFLVAAYPFHRGKLNESRVREVIEDAVDRVTQQRVSVTAVLHDELGGLSKPVTPGGGGTPPGSSGKSAPREAPPVDPGNGSQMSPDAKSEKNGTEASTDSQDDAILARAKAIFEAEEVRPDSLPGAR